MHKYVTKLIGREVGRGLFIAVTLRSFMRRAATWLKVVLLLLLVLYILPQLVLMLWNANASSPKLQEPVIEKPLRVHNIHHCEIIYKKI